jgi:hypothetical protein
MSEGNTFALSFCHQNRQDKNQKGDSSVNIAQFSLSLQMA